MIIGVGTDILHLQRLSGLEGQWEDVFFRSTFTPAECSAAVERSRPLLYFADRFAGKEAVFKALRIPSDAIRLNEIEILDDEEGRPFVRLYGRALAVAEGNGVRNIHVSLSYEDDTALAFAVCED